MNEARDNGLVRILVMDDEICIRETTQLLLEELGYRVDGVQDCEQAIRFFSDAIASGERYCIVLLDLTIRGGKGAEETLAAIKELDPSISSVLISGYHHTPPMLNPKQYGFCARLRKPYSADELRETIIKLLSIPTI